MSLITVIINILIGALGYAMLYHLVAGLGRQDFIKHLLLALICLLSIVFVSSRALSIHSQELSVHLVANQVGVACGATVFILLMWFVALRVQLQARQPLLWLSAFGAAIVCANGLMPYGIQYRSASELVLLNTRWEEPIMVIKGQISPWFLAATAWALMILSFTSVMALRFWWRARGWLNGIVAFAAVVYLLLNLQGLWVRLGAPAMPYTGMLGIMLVLLVVSLAYIQEDRLERKKSADHLRDIFDGAPDAILVFAGNGLIKAANPAAQLLFGATEATLLNTNIKTLIPNQPLPQPLVGQQALSLPEPDQPLARVAIAARKLNGPALIVDLSVAPIEWNLEPASVVFIRDASVRVEQARHLEWLALHDEKTTLPNRTALLTFLAQHTSEHYYLAMLGVDNLGRINEAFGHENGDSVISALAQQLLAFTLDDEYCARLEGDHFIFVSNSPERIQRLHQQLQAPVVFADQVALHINVSVGYVDLGIDAQPLESLQQAQSALVQAKKRGHGSLEVFDEACLNRDLRWLDLASRMRTALHSNEFSLVYQPRFTLHTGLANNFEALLRWRTREGVITPAEFIPIAEDTGFIVALGDWVLEQVMRQASEWRGQGLPVAQLAVNVSIRQLASPDFVDKLLALLAQYHMPAARLELELTETAAMENLDFVRDNLNRLAAEGISLALDDFGTGYSSLAYLQKLPFRIIKLDMSFVHRLGTAKGDELMSGMIALLSSLKRKMVAEGIETDAQLNWLREAGCDEGQGYLLSRPLSVELATRWLAGHRPEPEV